MDFAGVKAWFGVLPQEYLCVAMENLSTPLSVYATTKEADQVVDVTGRTIMLGYNPLIMAVAAGEAESICLNFCMDSSNPASRWRGFPSLESSIGRIEMKGLKHSFRIPSWNLFVGVYGQHQFLRTHQRLAYEVLSLVRRKPASNANISGNLYDQVRIAYSVPRQISVITVKDKNVLNFFPTDLHGRLDAHHYISSLRIGGMACNQVMQTKTIVISMVGYASYKEVYALGKNHMRDMLPANRFPKSSAASASGIPIYPLATGYMELEMLTSHDVGIHRLFLYRIIEERMFREENRLGHVHAHYVQWRTNHGLSTDYFVR